MPAAGSSHDAYAYRRRGDQAPAPSFQHQLNSKHLQPYPDEIAFRHNNRENPYLFRDTLLRLINSKSLS